MPSAKKCQVKKKLRRLSCRTRMPHQEKREGRGDTHGQGALTDHSQVLPLALAEERTPS